MKVPNSWASLWLDLFPPCFPLLLEHIVKIPHDLLATCTPCTHDYPNYAASPLLLFLHKLVLILSWWKLTGGWSWSYLGRVNYNRALEPFIDISSSLSCATVSDAIKWSYMTFMKSLSIYACICSHICIIFLQIERLIYIQNSLVCWSAKKW